LHTLLLNQEFLSKKSKICFIDVYQPQKEEGIHLEEKILFLGRNEITAEGLKILQWSARRRIPERYLITNSTGMSGAGFGLIFESAR